MTTEIIRTTCTWLQSPCKFCNQLVDLHWTVKIAYHHKHFFKCPFHPDSASALQILAHYSMPFVDGTPADSSLAKAWRNANANALNAGSALWWLFASGVSTSMILMLEHARIPLHRQRNALT
jgi:hypothetical protein